MVAVTIGLVAGYWPGVIDQLLSFVTNLALVIPALPLIILYYIGTLGVGLWSTVELEPGFLGLRLGVWLTLPDDYRAPVLLQDSHELSSPEIAALLGTSVATAKIRIHRGRAEISGAHVICGNQPPRC